MEQIHYREMINALETLEHEGKLRLRSIYLFGHCEATEKLIDCLLKKQYCPIAILDNNVHKYGKEYKGVRVVPPSDVLQESPDRVLVCIVARAYEAMASQLRQIGYTGEIRKLVDYNSFAEYSLSAETLEKMYLREREGEQMLLDMRQIYKNDFFVFCPFNALGDIYIMMSYLPAFLMERKIKQCVIFVVGSACADVVKLFGKYPVEKLTQEKMDKMVQAVLYGQDNLAYVAHQDRPYIIDLHKALYEKKITLNQIYCCGVFGLSPTTRPVEPISFEEYPDLKNIPKGRSVIFSPYAKSVTALNPLVWEELVSRYKEKGFACFTNAVGEEKPLWGTEPVSPQISQIKSLVEWAGAFVGIRSGLCDVLMSAVARKIALYPDYNYCDTKWKAIDMYFLDGWENIEVEKEGFPWQIIR